MSQATIVNMEIKRENEGTDSVQSSVPDEASQRLSFIEDPSGLKLLLRRSISLDSMRQFLSKVRHAASLLTPEKELEYLLLAVNCIDLTTLAGDDTSTNVERLCCRAVHSLDEDETPGYPNVTCAAVCVYPARVVDCVRSFKKLKVPLNIAAVATGFPSGQYGLKSRLAEIREAVESGATEIDVVINRAAALAGQWPVVFEEICEMRKACDILKDQIGGQTVHMKVILGAGDLLTADPSTIYSAGMVAILAGADFIKTSTGKEGVNATLPIGYIMMRTIADYHNLTGVKIGFKPAGGLKTHKDALEWLLLVKMLLGPGWMNNKLFRFGASGLLDSLEKRIQVLTKASTILTTKVEVSPSSQ